MKLISLNSTNDGVGDIKRRMKKDWKFSKEIILAETVLEKKDV